MEPRLRTAPTRIWWVVNRRLLVDSTADHAESLARVLAEPHLIEVNAQGQEIVATIGERLRRIGATQGANPIDVIRLRGGVSARSAADPSRPTIMLCTLPMYASRLLFRGYGTGRRRRALDAAMAGTDSLVLLDEAHLAPHLKALITASSACAPASEQVLNCSRSKPVVAELTATGDKGEGSFNLDDADLANCVVKRRMRSAKPLELLEYESGTPVRPLADAAIRLVGESSSPASCLVFANSPENARGVFERIRHTLGAGNAEFLLLTGMTRERESERVRKRILDPNDGMAANRAADTVRTRHLIVVSTQNLGSRR